MALSPDDRPGSRITAPAPVRRKKKKARSLSPDDRPFQRALVPARKQTPQKKRHVSAPAAVSTGPRQHARGRFAAPPLSKSLPRFGPKPKPRKPPELEGWARERFMRPDPQDELETLGFEGAAQFARYRDKARKDLARKLLALKQAQHDAQPHGIGGWAKAAPGIAKRLPGAIAHEATAGVGEKLEDFLVGDRFAAAKARRQQRLPEQFNHPAVRAGIAIGELGEASVDPLIGKALANFLGGDVSQLWKHPAALTAEAALLHPGLRPIRGARAITSGFRAAVRGSKITAEIEGKLSKEEITLLRRAEKSLKKKPGGEGLTPRQRRALAKAESHMIGSRLGRFKSAYQGVLEGPSVARLLNTPAKMKLRTFKAGDLEVKIPAAKSYTGRGIERVLDATRRKAGGRVPLWKSEEQRALEEFTRLTKYETRQPETKIRRLQQLNHMLNDEKQQAIRLSLEGSSSEQAVEHHMALAGSPEISEEQKAFHLIHASVFEKAGKYLNVTPEGRVELIPNAPKFMAEARGLLIDVAETREEGYKEIRALFDEGIANRITGPARVRGGARWQEAEDQLRAELQDSPMRKAALEEAKVLAARMTDDPERQRIAVDAAMTLWESNIRVMARDVHGNQAEWREFQDLIRFGRGPIPEDALQQSTIIQAKEYWNRMLEGASAEVRAKIPG